MPGAKHGRTRVRGCVDLDSVKQGRCRSLRSQTGLSVGPTTAASGQALLWSCVRNTCSLWQLPLSKICTCTHLCRTQTHVGYVANHFIHRRLCVAFSSKHQAGLPTPFAGHGAPNQATAEPGLVCNCTSFYPSYSFSDVASQAGCSWQYPGFGKSMYRYSHCIVEHTSQCLHVVADFLGQRHKRDQQGGRPIVE